MMALITPYPPTGYATIFSSASTTVKGVIEGLDPTPPSLRWEAHRGTPVSTLCALEKTPLLATASTDSTVRLFTLANIQVSSSFEIYTYPSGGLRQKVDMAYSIECGSHDKPSKPREMVESRAAEIAVSHCSSSGMHVQSRTLGDSSSL